MSLTRNEFEKMLDQLLAGELPDDQLAAFEDSAARDLKASRELDRVRNLQAILRRDVRDYRRITYPGNLAMEVLDRSDPTCCRPCVIGAGRLPWPQYRWCSWHWF